MKKFFNLFKNKSNNEIGLPVQFDPESKETRLLHIEDDKFLLRIYTMKFKDAGFNVAIMENANDDEVMFVDRVAALNPDLILIGIIMPGRDGLEAIRLLRGDNRTKSLPIIVLTNQGDSKDISKAKELGVLGYLIKATLTPSDVTKEIKRIFWEASLQAKPVISQ
jgi:CheY-like chemotaxis protein